MPCIAYIRTYSLWGEHTIYSFTRWYQIAHCTSAGYIVIWTLSAHVFATTRVPLVRLKLIYLPWCAKLQIGVWTHTHIHSQTRTQYNHNVALYIAPVQSPNAIRVWRANLCAKWECTQRRMYLWRRPLREQKLTHAHVGKSGYYVMEYNVVVCTTSTLGSRQRYISISCKALILNRRLIYNFFCGADQIIWTDKSVFIC